MQRGDKIVLGTVVPVIVIVLVVAVILYVYIKPCPHGMKYDTNIKACRKKCPGEGKASGQSYDKTTGVCVCADKNVPVFDTSLQQCIGDCEPGTVWNVKSKSCDRIDQQCTPMPSVNTTTGTIVNASHFPDGRGGCSIGSMKQLDDLCKSSSCNNTDFCRAGDRWDGVAKNGTECYKEQVCGMLPCTTNYCTSDSVRTNVGAIMQVTDSNGKCVNPSESTVGSMCTHDGMHAWRAPECYSTTPLTTLRVLVTSASSEAGKGIVGTVEHGLVNGALDLNATGMLVYQYTLSTPSFVRLNNEMMQLTAQDTIVATGGVTLTGVCQPTDGAAVCFTFHIDDDNIRRLPEATYVLRLTGFPSWDVTLPLYVTSQPPALTLLGPSVAPGALDQLKVEFTLSDAKSVATDTFLLQPKLADLKKMHPDEVVTDPTVVAPTHDSMSVSDQAVILDCQGGFCRTDEHITRKLVVLAWAPLKLDKYVMEGICPGAGGGVVKYYLARSHTETQGSQTVVVDETLIGPTTAQFQPSETEVKLGIISFVDLVDVNRVVTYKLGAYLASSAESTVEYRNAKCYGPMQSMMVSIGQYTAAGCHQIMYGVENSIPPYMTRTSAGTCVYDDSQPAQDFYCLFDYTWKDKPQPGFDQSHMALSSKNGKGCFSLQTMYPAFKVDSNNWDGRFAKPESLQACITGLGQDVTVECADKLRLETVGDMFTKSDLQARLGKVYDNFDTYKYSDALDASKAKLNVNNDTNQLNTLFDTYARCPVRNNPNYGYDERYDICNDLTISQQTCKDQFLPLLCETGDEVCKQLLEVSHCNYNTCGPWEANSDYEFTRHRVAYYDEKSPDAAAKCCNGKGTYAKGKCTCNEKVFGAQCEQDPCLEHFRDHRAKGGLDCTPLGLSTPTGTCVPDASGAVSCACNANYYNVAQPPALDIYKDCKWYKKEFINNPASPSGSQQFNPFNDNPQKMACEAAQRVDPTTSLCNGIQCNPYPYGLDGARDPNCIIDPYSCKCPDVLPDPYMCRQLELPENQKGGNVVPDPLNPKEAVAATGCNVKCSQHKPTPSEPYKFADPENNNLACTSCFVGGSCEEAQDTYQSRSVDERTYCFCKFKPVAYPDMSWYDKYCYGFDETKYDPSKYNCAYTNMLAQQSYIFPSHYCTNCCFNYCKKNSHDHHWCDNGKWPVS